jgi:3-hydroxyacyl-CoA dehydrogenase
MDLVDSEISGAVAVITIRNPPVNALSARLRGDIFAAIGTAIDDPAVAAIVLTAQGKAFVAGADIAEFGKPPVSPTLPEVIARIEASQKPVVAALNGLALGGGLELAFAAHFRLAVPDVRVGLPEIKLGILPGAGGTQRLPRLMGPEKAFRMMASGEPLPAKDVVASGIIDAIVDGDLVKAARSFALARVGGPLPCLSQRAPFNDASSRAAFEAAAKDIIAKDPDATNVIALADCVRASLDKPFAEGLAIERAHFLKLTRDPRSRALRHLFFAEREAQRVPGVGKDDKPRPIAKAAVIGAGTMGGGIAMCFAQAGIPVTLIEQKAEALAAGIARIRGNWDTSVKRGSLTPDAFASRMALITGAVGLEAAGDADIVVEAAFEDMAVKAEIFGALDIIAKPGAILATNTSYLDVNSIAGFTQRPHDVVGLHFFSPANVMKLLEIVRAEKTGADVIATSLELARKLAKLPVVVGVCHGFVGNRMLAKRGAAAERLLLAGALPHEIDAALTDFGFRMGPFAMGDLAGLDVGWRNRKANGGFAPVADALCELGRFGQKTKRGFYLYPEGARKGERDPEVEAMIVEMSAARGISRRSFSRQEIIAHLFYPMVNEGAKILEDVIAARAGDIDLVWINGYNWPMATGGPMHWADGIGLSSIVVALDDMADAMGDESLRPADLLRRLGTDGATFTRGAPDPQTPVWQRHFPNTCDWDAPIEIATLPEVLDKGIAIGGARPAIDFRGMQLSFVDLGREVTRLASGFAAQGISAGDAVALLLPNTPWHPIAFFAIARLGARIVNLSPLDAPREIAHKLGLTGAKAIVTTNLDPVLALALEQLDAGAVDRVYVGDDARWGVGDTEPRAIPGRTDVLALEAIANDLPFAGPAPKPEDIAVLQFTGGTTGLPKAAMLTHANLTAAVSMYRLWRDGDRPLVPGEERVVAVLPLFHIYALTTILLRHIRDGNTLMLRQRFDVDTLVTDIETGRASQFSGVPTMWVALLHRPGVETVDFSSLKSCVSGGAPLPFEVQARIERLIGLKLNNGWGMTETAPAGSRVPAAVPSRPGLIGIPLAGLSIRIVALDDPVRAVATGEIGEIAIRGPNVFAGYLGDAEATEAAFADGWFLTGDIGRMDTRGLIEIVDRRKNMIISSGFNIYPAAIENAIHEHPDVDEVIVIGVPDDYRGQSAKAYIKLRHGAPALTLDELNAFLASRLGRQEHPRALEIRDALPKSAAGKLLARELIAEMAAANAAGAP